MRHYLLPSAYSSLYLPLSSETELRAHTEHLRQLPCGSTMCICLYTYIRDVCIYLFIYFNVFIEHAPLLSVVLHAVSIIYMCFTFHDVCLFGECAKHCTGCDLFLMVRNSL